MMKIRTYSGLGGILLLVFLATVGTTAPSQNLFSNVPDKKIEEFLQAGKINGLQLAFISDKEFVVKKYGRSRNGKAWSDHDLLRIASISKSFLAALFFKIADSNGLKHSDTLDQFVSSDLLPKIDIKKVRIGDLLRHTSGIPDYFTKEFIQSILDSPDKVKTERDALSAILLLGFKFEPGTSFDYSNTNYVLLGLILDIIAKKQGYSGHQELLRKFILEPARLGSTFYENKEVALYKPEHIVSGFLDGNDFLNIQQGYGLPNGGLISSVKDVALFFDALFDPMSALGVGTKMIPSENENFGYGLYRLPANKAFIGHTGEFAGYLSFAGHNPHHRVTIVGFTDDSSGLAKEQFRNLQEYLFSRFDK